MMTIAEQIIECENTLLNALRAKDVATVEALIHDNLLFTIPTGQTITKEIDLKNLQSGLMTIDDLVPSEQVIKVTDDLATVAVTIHLTGKYMGTAIDEHFRYLRVWKMFDRKWKIIAGSAVQIKP